MKERNEIMRFFGLHPQNDVRRKVATHVDNSNNKRKFAFTLAEVLVTLGIIGVVAVLTVPNVIFSYQKKVYVVQLQKAYNQLQQVFSLAMAEDEVEYLADTELMQSINGDRIGYHEDQSAFLSKLGEYMKIQKICRQGDLTDGCHDTTYKQMDGDRDSNRRADLQVFTKNGMIYYFPMAFSKYPFAYWYPCEIFQEDGGNLCLTHMSVQIDINGKKGPNISGRDFFIVYIDDKGQLYPYGSASMHGKNRSALVATDNSEYTCSDHYGAGCFGRIYDSDWVMDY